MLWLMTLALIKEVAGSRTFTRNSATHVQSTYDLDINVMAGFEIYIVLTVYAFGTLRGCLLPRDIIRCWYDKVR